MQHKVVHYDFHLDKHFDIELAFEDFREKDHFLGRTESLEVVLGLKHERQCLEFVLQIDVHADFLSFAIQDSVAESD